MTIKQAILSEIEIIAVELSRKLPPLEDETFLSAIGLDSLCWAILVTRLEEELGIDPFAATDDVLFPVSLGELIRMYQDAAQQQYSLLTL